MNIDEIQIDYDDIPLIDIGRDTLVCDDDFIMKLEPGGDENVSYRWSNGSINSKFYPPNSGLYWVEATNHCGSFRDTINIYAVKDVFIPDVITANGDDYNEQWQIALKDNKNGEYITDMMMLPRIKVFDRWGVEIYSDDYYQNNWPGPYVSLSPGTYYYQIAYPQCKTFSGWLQILR